MLCCDIFSDSIFSILGIDPTQLENSFLQRDFASSVCAWPVHLSYRFISKAPSTSLANIRILTGIGRIQDILQTLQYIKPIAEPAEFFNLD